MEFLEEKTSVLKWLISAQGLKGIPSILDGYHYSSIDLQEQFKATLDENGFPIPLNVVDLYLKDGRRISVSEISQEIVVNLSSQDVLNGCEILPRPKEYKHYTIENIEIDTNNACKIKFSLNNSVE